MASQRTSKTGVALFYDSKAAIIDICFIHGLGGDREETWQKKKIVWPKDLLPKDIPVARILTWGYNADVLHFWTPSSNSTVDDHAKNLAEELRDFRKEPNTLDRPLIFVAHSLGGLICARSLVLSGMLQTVVGVSEHTRRIAFLGTPFLGSDKVKWAKTIKAFYDMMKWSTTSDELLKYLEKESPTLATLGEKFPQWLQRREGDPTTGVGVVCFQETTPSIFGEIVKKESAKLPGQETRTLEATHENMCKFASADDANYKRICGVLQQWVEEIKNGVSNSTPNSSQYTSNATFSGNNYGGNQQGQAILHGGTQTFGSGSTYNFDSN